MLPYLTILIMDNEPALIKKIKPNDDLLLPEDVEDKRVLIIVLE